MRSNSLTLWAVGFLCGLAAAAAPAESNRTTVPALLGKYKVAISTHEIKTSRPDPLAPKKRKRRFMVTVHQPFTDCNSTVTPFAPIPIQDILSSNTYQVDVPNGTFARLQLQNCREPDFGGPAFVKDAPLLIFSPGLEESSYYFGATHAAVASSGYTVVSLEHTYESPAVLFPNGDIVTPNLRNNFSSPDDATAYYGNVLTPLRTADAISTLDAIEARKIPGLEAYASNGRTSRVGIYGHSLGGCTAVDAISKDERFVGGINVDGSIFGNVSNITLTTPFLLINGIEAPPREWNDFWQHLQGWKLNIRVRRAAHEAFMDFPLIADLLGTRGQPAQSPQRLGSIKGTVIQRILWAYTVAFFDFLVKGERPALLEGPSEMYPQVIYQRMNETVS